MHLVRVFSLFLAIICAVLPAVAAQRSYSIVFGNAATSTNMLTNATFLNSVTEGKSYIKNVTSVVAVYPDRPDCIRLSSNKTNGKFNIELADDARVVAKKIVVNAARYDNDRDADASLMVNSEILYIPSTEAADYTISIPSRPEKTLTNLIIDAEYRVYIYSITVWYDDSQGTVNPDIATVAAPQITPAGGTVSAGSTVSMSCTTQGADIYYTIDGADPTSSAILYTEPFALYNDLTVKAFATKDGMNPSETVQADFTVRTPEAYLESYFDFSNPSSLNPAVAEPAEKGEVLLDGRTFTDGDAAISFFATGTGNTSVRLYGSYDAGCDLRVYSGDSFTVQSLNPNIAIESIDFEISASSGSQISLDASNGYFDDFDYTWLADDSGSLPTSVTFTSIFQSRFKSMTVHLTGLNGIENIDYDHDVREVWYNIQGVRVPAGIATPGFYIRVAPGSTSKHHIR